MPDNGKVIWDAIIVGAGPAGCAAAYDLAAAGRRVLLLDKASFPRSKACAGALTMKAVRALRYTITPVVRKSVSDAMLEHRSDPKAGLPISRRTPFCLMTVRAELDAYCLDQTRARGAAFRQIGSISGLSEQQDDVLLHLLGEADPVRGRFVIGADGVHSRVRALSERSKGNALWFRKGFAVEANVPYSATGRAFPLTFDFAPVMGGYGWLFPRNDHVNVGLYTASDPAQAASQLPAERSARIGCETAPGSVPAVDRAALARYIRARCGTDAHGGVTGQFLGLGAAGYAPSASRVLLVGDAAGFVDPLTGEGIHGAITSGQQAAAAILSSLTGGGDASALYSVKTHRQRADLAVSERAAVFFYGEPERGLRLMRLPLAGRAVLHAYSDGAGLSTLARVLRTVRGLVRGTGK